VLLMGYLALRQGLHWGRAGEMHQRLGINLVLMYVYLLGSAAFNFGFIALVLQRLTTRLREQSVRDGLTGLLNRRAMDAALERQWARQQRARTPLSVLMVDIDHFKLVNDRLGHAAGDEVLRKLARLLQLERRTDDAVGRVGGEEFLVLLPGVPAAMAAQLAERLRESVETAKIGATVSVGVSQSGGREDDVDNLLRRADEALYQAKAKGRNRVEVAY
jgi:diguanylate cyclase (GGDEF)-like protein